MIVVSDTTAITSLLKINQAELLQRLFREIVIPTAVRDELLKYHCAIPEFLQIITVRDTILLSRLLSVLDRGEAEAIVLAKEIQADALLIDEKLGRSVAEQEGIRCLGLAAALLLARKTGIIPSLRVILDDLEQHANFYLRPELREQLLLQAAE